MSKAEFFQYVKKNRSVMSVWVVFALQQAIRRKVFGEEYWAQLIHEGRRYVPRYYMCVCDSSRRPARLFVFVQDATAVVVDLVFHKEPF